jgi:hypothetical protein
MPNRYRPMTYIEGHNTRVSGSLLHESFCKTAMMENLGQNLGNRHALFVWAEYVVSFN